MNLIFCKFDGHFCNFIFFLNQILFDLRVLTVVASLFFGYPGIIIRREGTLPERW